MKNVFVFLFIMLFSLSFSFDKKRENKTIESKDKKVATTVVTAKKEKRKVETEDDKIRKQWFKIVSKWEGGVGNRPKHEDPSGLTNHGITIWYWKNSAHKIVGKKPTAEALKTLTWAEAEKICNSFWKTSKIDKIKNPALRIMVAEAYWGSGKDMALKSFGYKSINGINRDTKLTPLHLYNVRLSWLKRLKNWEYNKTGWTKRLNDNLKISNKFNKKC